MNEYIVKYPNGIEECGIKIKEKKGHIEIVEYTEEIKELSSVWVEKGIELGDLLRYLKELEE